MTDMYLVFGMLCSYPDYAHIPVPEPDPQLVKEEPADDNLDKPPPLPASSSRLDQPSVQHQIGLQAASNGSLVSADGGVVFQGAKINILELQAELVCLSHSVAAPQDQST